MKNYQVERNLTQKQSRGPTIWKDMRKTAVKDIVGWLIKKTKRLYKLSTPCLDDHNLKKEELETVGELCKVCSQIVFKCLYFARIDRPDILWSVNKLTRAVTKWTSACDKRWARLTVRYHRQYGHVANTAQHCRLCLFEDSDFADDLED